MNDRLMLDTNVVTFSLGGNTHVTSLINHKEHFISEITEIELLGFHGLTVQDEKIPNTYLSETRIISINASIKELAIEIKRNYKLKTIDAIIAASAIYFDLSLLLPIKLLKRLWN